MSSSRPGRPLTLLVRMAIFLLVFGGVAEIWLRTVMPAAEVPLKYQDQPATIFRLDSQRLTSGLYTYGRRCLPAGEWRVNNAGWNSAVDYSSAAERRRPMVAIFGDSYIEGLLSDVDQHVDAYLPETLPGTDCYAFGLSGWYLEQYVAVSRYAEERFQPDVLVLFVGNGDVEDSLSETSPFLWRLDTRGQSFEEVPPSAAYTASPKLVLAQRSALFRYVRYNAKLAVPGMRGAAVPQPAAEGGAPAQDAGAEAPAADAWRELLPAADFMVDRLCAEHPGTPIVFVGKGDRYLPVKDVSRTPLAPGHRAVEAACEGRDQCFFLDLRYAFSRDWAAHHIRFEAADGAHWNAHCNRVVARALAAYIEENDLL